MEYEVVAIAKAGVNVCVAANTVTTTSVMNAFGLVRVIVYAPCNDEVATIVLLPSNRFTVTDVPVCFSAD